VALGVRRADDSAIGFPDPDDFTQTSNTDRSFLMEPPASQRRFSQMNPTGVIG